MNKISVYQLFLRVFSNENTTNKFYGTLKENGTGKFSDINKEALQSIKRLGISHIWFTGVVEHATMEDFAAYGIPKDHPEVVKGIAGSPYAIKDYYDVNAYLADNVAKRMQEFEALVERTHKAGLKVIIDFVPNHVARQYKSDAAPKGVNDFGFDDDQSVHFKPNNNFYYIPNKAFRVPDGVNPPIEFDSEYEEFPAKATGNDVFSAEPSITDWFETVKLNYGVDYLNNRQTHFDTVPDTWQKMLHILLFWAEKGVDGFRCDMAEMVPVAFWNWVIPKVKAKFETVIFIAEIYNPNEYRNYLDFGHFDYLYDKVGLYDALRRLIEGCGNAMDISAVWQKESGDFSERMLRFLENHDEHRIASEEFGKTPQSAFAAFMLSATLHTGPIMVYGGQELGVTANQREGFQGNDGRTTIFDFWALPELQSWIDGKLFNEESIESERLAIRQFYSKVLHFAQENEAVYAGDFHDLQYINGFWQSHNYDERCIYSYLRFTENQCLLFVFNFDLNEDRHFNLKLPRTLFKDGIITLSFAQVFEGTENIELEVNDQIEFALAVKANQFKIFKINTK